MANNAEPTLHNVTHLLGIDDEKLKLHRNLSGGTVVDMQTQAIYLRIRGFFGIKPRPDLDSER